MKKNIWLDLPGRRDLIVGQYVVPSFMSNSVALQCSENRWLVISPGASLLEDWQARFAGQNIEVDILFPNSFHYLGVSAWLKAYPGAKLYASTKALPRLKKKGFDAVKSVEVSPPELPESYSFKVPPGHRGGDVWLCKSGESGLWICCDSFLNYERESNRLIARSMQRLLGAAPGLKMSQVVKWFILDERARFKEWVLELLQNEPPVLLIPSHGEPLEAEDLSRRISSLVSARL